MDTLEPEKILIIGPAWVGDMIMAQSLFITLKQQYPNCIIDVLAPAWTSPLLERMPEVANAIALDIGHGELLWSKRKALGKSLQMQGYSQAIVLPNSLKSALIPFFAKIPVRTGFLKEPRYFLLNDLRKLDKQRYPLMIERFNALAFPESQELPKSLPYPKLIVDPNSVEAAKSKYQLNEQDNILVLCPGAEFGPAKRWPEYHYAKVAEEHAKAGGYVWLMGSAKDREVTQQIIDAVNLDDALKTNQLINLAGQTSLAEAIDLMSCADMVVSNDSGLMHMAAAVGRKLVVVYGSSSPKFTPPLSEQVKIVSLDLECSPCFKRECPLGHLNCLKQLTPNLVLDAITQLQ